MADQTTGAKPMSEEREREIRCAIENRTDYHGHIDIGSVLPGRVRWRTIVFMDEVAELLATIDELRAERAKYAAEAARQTREADELRAKVEDYERDAAERVADAWHDANRAREKVERLEADLKAARKTRGNADRLLSKIRNSVEWYPDLGDPCNTMLPDAVRMMRDELIGLRAKAATDDLQARIDAAVAKAIRGIPIPLIHLPAQWRRFDDDLIGPGRVDPPPPAEPPLEELVDALKATDPKPEQPPEPFVDVQADYRMLSGRVRFEFRDASGEGVTRESIGASELPSGPQRGRIRIPDPRQVAELRARCDELQRGIRQANDLVQSEQERHKATRAKLAAAAKERDEIRGALGGKLLAISEALAGGPGGALVPDPEIVNEVRRAVAERDALRAELAALRSKLADIAKGGV